MTLAERAESEVGKLNALGEALEKIDEFIHDHPSDDLLLKSIIRQYTGRLFLEDVTNPVVSAFVMYNGDCKNHARKFARMLNVIEPK